MSPDVPAIPVGSPSPRQRREGVAGFRPVAGSGPRPRLGSVVAGGLVAVGLAAGGLAGWWLAREANRGMPWGFLVLVLAVLLLGVAAPFVWPGVLPDLAVNPLRAAAGAFATVAAWTVDYSLGDRGVAGEGDEPSAGRP